MGFPTGGTLISGCFSRRTSATSRPVFVQTSLKNTTPPLSVGDPTERLLHIYQQEGDVEAACQAILILFYTSLDADFPSPVPRQHIPHQAYMCTPLP